MKQIFLLSLIIVSQSTASTIFIEGNTVTKLDCKGLVKVTEIQLPQTTNIDAFVEFIKKIQSSVCAEDLDRIIKFLPEITLQLESIYEDSQMQGQIKSLELSCILTQKLEDWKSNTSLWCPYKLLSFLEHLDKMMFRNTSQEFLFHRKSFDS